MINSKLGNNNFLLFSSLIFFCFAVNLHINNPRPIFDIEMQERAVNVNKDLLRILSVGNKRTISSVLWVQTLLESDTQHYSSDDRQNWMYLRFDSISVLDPLFYQNYLWGGMYLSIIKNDLYGAGDIFDKGLVYYPDDYELNFRQGFNYYFELGDFEKGLHYLNKIAEHPKTPLNIKLIINKLRFETTANYDFALNYIWYNIKNEKDPDLVNKLTQDFYALKAERDLKCLNQAGSHCERRDAEGNSYVRSQDGWIAPRNFKPYRIYLPPSSKEN